MNHFVYQSVKLKDFPFLQIFLKHDYQIDFFISKRNAFSKKNRNLQVMAVAKLYTTFLKYSLKKYGSFRSRKQLDKILNCAINNLKLSDNPTNKIISDKTYMT